MIDAPRDSSGDIMSMWAAGRLQLSAVWILGAGAKVFSFGRVDHIFRGNKMSSRKVATACVALLGAAMLWGGEAQAGRRNALGAQGDQLRGCRALVTLKHPEAKGAARTKEVDKCVADPNGYNT